MEIMKLEVKMTSRDLAEITGKQHAHIMRDIRGEIDALGEVNESIFGLVDYTDAKGEKRPQYIFGRKGAMQLALKYDAVIRYKVIQKLEELEGRNKPMVINSQFLYLMAGKLEEQEKQIAIMSPKAEYFDELVDRNLLTNLRDTAKELKLGPKIFNQWLLDKKYLYRDLKGKLKPHAPHTPSLFELKEFVKGDYTDTQTLVTPRGRETFRMLLSREGA
jgi:phage antirepressor YoqD-like protein